MGSRRKREQVQRQFDDLMWAAASIATLGELPNGYRLSVRFEDRDDEELTIARAMIEDENGIVRATRTMNVPYAEERSSRAKRIRDRATPHTRDDASKIVRL
jgi:hypothetical protein